MKVENNPINPTSMHRAENSYPVNASGQSQASEKSGRADRVELSEQARLLAQAHAILENLPADEPRQARVEQLRGQIETGSYTVPVQSLARKLLERLTNQTPSQE